MKGVHRMSKVRSVVVFGAMAAMAAVPLVTGSVAGAQDAGDCGSGGVAVSSSQTNVGGLLGAVAPIQSQVVTPLNAPISSPNAVNCNENVNKVNTGGGHSGGGTGGGGTGGGGTGGGHSAGTGGGSGGVGGASVAVPVSGAPRFAG